MATFDELLAANDQYVATFDRGDLPMPPAKRVAILTCMDARLHPEKFLGLDVGDAHVIRNAGGRASQDAVRSLIISQRLLGTNEIVVIHHTDCGMQTFQNNDLVAKIQADLQADASGWDFLPFADLEESVRADVQTLRESLFIPVDIPITGAIYDVRTGRLHEVVRSDTSHELGGV
jgi:carbonic anhydrase